MKQLFAAFSSVVPQSAEGTETVRAKGQQGGQKNTSHQHFAQPGKYKAAAVVDRAKPRPWSSAECV